jgi:2-hydroxychromene-2-carboxylate isomerase
MAGSLDFFYFFGSTYSYLSVMRIGRLAEAAGVEVRWRPFSVRALMVEQGNLMRSQPAVKTAYMFRDIARRAALHGLPFVKPPIWPTDPDQLANRVGTVAMVEGWCPAYTRASFLSWYAEGRPLGEPAALAEILAGLGRDPAAVIERANGDEIRARYDAETDAARRLSIFGSPSFAVGTEIFWGDDRLEEALAWAAGTHPGQRR